MQKLFKVSTILFQLITTMIALVAFYILFAILDNYEADLISEVGMLTIQPVYAVIYSVITILICVAVGLPIRLNSGINRWWTNRPSISIGGVIVGVFLLLLSINSSFSQTVKILTDGQEVEKQIPNNNFVASGWFLLAFSLLHFYPLQLIKIIRDKFKKGG